MFNYFLNYILGLLHWKYWLIIFIGLIFFIWILSWFYKPKKENISLVKNTNEKKDERSYSFEDMTDNIDNSLHIKNKQKKVTFQKTKKEKRKRKNTKKAKSDDNTALNRRNLEYIMCDVARELFPGYEFENTRPDWLRNPETGHKMELDCYCEELKINFEGHGIQHLVYPNPISKSKEEFESQVRRDLYKKEICDEKGIYHLEIPFYQVVKKGANLKEAQEAIKEFILKHINSQIENNNESESDSESESESDSEEEIIEPGMT